ncbi:hypothetical protein JCM6882_005118 [Rhodosporidiobolus microsporus]
MHASRLSSLDRLSSPSSHPSAGGGVWRPPGGGWRERERQRLASATTGRGDDNGATFSSFGSGGSRWAGSGAGSREWASPAAPRQDDENPSAVPSIAPAPEDTPMMWKGAAYVPAQRREHLGEASAPPPPPTEEYLATSLQRAFSDPELTAQFPRVVVLSLAHTLLQRIKRSPEAAGVPVVRPYLSTFLEYVVGSDSATYRPRFHAVVFSSARFRSAVGMLSAIDLVPPFEPKGSRYYSNRDEGDVLAAVITREHLGLNEADFFSDVPVVKDLAKVSRVLGLGKAPSDASFDTRMARNVVLVDENADAARQQPYNLLPISPFLLHDSDFPEGEQTPGAVELDANHPLANDTALLGTIYLLDRLRVETNIASTLRGGLVRNIRDEIKRPVRFREKREMSETEVDAILAQRGRAVCAEQGIEVRREWDPEWRSKLLEKEGRVLSAETIERQQAQKEAFLRRDTQTKPKRIERTIDYQHGYSREMDRLARQTERTLRLDEDDEDARERRAFSNNDYDYEEQGGW